MSDSPLSAAMAQTEATEKKKKKRGGALLLVSGLALTVSLSGVFASSTIAINGAADIEFGSGVETASACDTQLTAQITQAWSQSANAFQVQNVVLEDVGSTCNTETISVILAGTDGAPICDIAGTDTATDVNFSGVTSYSAAVGKDKFTVTNIASTVSITIPAAANCNSSSVSRVAIATN